MRQAVFVTTLVLLVIAGAGSAAFAAKDWNGLTSGDDLVKLGVLLFLSGAGLGALVVLLITWMVTLCRKNKQEKAVAETVKAEAEQKLPDDVSKETPKDTSINIHVYHMQTASGHTEIKAVTDATLLNKLGISFKHLMHKMSLKLPRWDSASSGDMFTPSKKPCEKATQNVDTIATPTPRIYVLPPDEPEGTVTAQCGHSRHSRSQSEIPAAGKMRAPSITILDMKTYSNDSDDDVTDVKSGQLSNKSSQSLDTRTEIVVEENDAAEKQQLRSTQELPQIRTVDTELATFVSSLESPSNKPVYMLSIMFEEVLPRPDSGLLKRMLRMSEIPVGRLEGSGEPILHLRVGSECHLSVGLIKLNHKARDLTVSGPHSIKLKPLDGEEVELNATWEAVDTIEHVTSAFWDLKSHTASHSLTRASSRDSTSTVLTPIEMTFGFHIHYPEESNFIQRIEVKKTFMASMRRDLVSLKVDERFTYDDEVLDFLLTKMELISMPSLLTFLELEPRPLS